MSDRQDPLLNKGKEMSQDIKLYDKNDGIADKGYHAKPY